MFWWGKFRQKVETFMLSLIVVAGNLVRGRRNSRQYLLFLPKVEEYVAHLPLYHLIFNPR